MKKALFHLSGPLFMAMLLLPASSDAQESRATIQVGDVIKAINANDDQGNLWQLSDHLHAGKYLVVYFYPAAMTSGCTAQACTYRDTAGQLKAVNAEIVGVSADSVNNLRIFKQAHRLNFTLLSDVSAAIARQFGVPMHSGGTVTVTVGGKDIQLTRPFTLARWTFVLDSTGKVLHIDTAVSPQQDASEVIEFIKTLE